jgi:predicted transport protein
MASLTYTKPERFSLRDHSEYNERWVQARIAEDPGILGLGDLVLKDKERLHPKAGRLDLLLQDPDTNKRYEVEIQLGKTDEAHIIRTIEYWDIERKRYPQYEHAAVIVAEDITSRFLNVISLFNGVIPLIALQLRAMRVGSSVTLICTKVLDELQLGLVDDDEEIEVPSNRAYWEERGSKDSVALVDSVHQLIKTFAPEVELKYNKHYIGLARGDQPDNFVVFRPMKGWLRVGLGLEKSEDQTAELENAGLDLMRYDPRAGKYLIRIQKEDLEKHRELLTRLMNDASQE